MKFLKLTLALAAGLLLAATSSHAQIPIAFSLQANYAQGSPRNNQGVSVAINNASLLSKIKTYLGITLPSGSGLAVNTNGNIVVVNANNAIIIDLSAGTNLATTNVVTHGFHSGIATSVTNVTSRSVSFDGVFFFDAVWTGSQSSNSVASNFVFNVIGKALDDGITIRFSMGTASYSYNGQVGSQVPSSEETYDLNDVAVDAISTALNSSGVYTLGFTIKAAGSCFASNQGEGYVTATITAKGTQHGGQSFLDPFNGFGNFDNF